MSGKSGRSGRRTADEERKLMDLLNKSYAYLNDNFTKFNQENKIKISLELIKRRVPKEINKTNEVTIKITHEEIEDRIPCLQSAN